MKIERIVVGNIATNCYIVYDESSGKAFLIDPGDNANKILNKIREKALKIEYIILTHAHYDHVLAAYEILEEKGVQLAAHSLEKERLVDPVASGHKYFRVKKHKALVPDVVLEDCDVLIAGELQAKILHTPGHSEGGICIIIENVIFTGDTLFKDTCGRCDLIGGDFDAMLKSLKILYEIDGNYTIYPGHGESSNLDYERKHNPYMLKAIEE